MSWYAERWRIEDFHRTLKSGCRIEDRRLGRGERLETCLAIDWLENIADATHCLECCEKHVGFILKYERLRSRVSRATGKESVLMSKV